ncbi:peptide methionine sulfoxide reductase MsrA/MsrB 1 [Metamycoplasma equirhinis]|uniref:peptide-methionine (R)-S-oxide reductase MsrB n=1 Tax=Metamycoplasma equirhinis TaxID=92402 RepID=UPI002572CD02|nr:peptide-methionine (R)-S-oxide reductase MsrB [Metamycoplasma equirhinis]BDX52831.1 peptide methionine sulfoxide reductase MsrA/MsrB 1 [Metamycoplasma equirhinis]
MNKIYLAGGCFWGMQAYFSKIKGIINTNVGYANGLTLETNYHNIKETDHAETLEIEYDENIINIAEIFERYLTLINPYSRNRQGGDIGRQYRTGIYFVDEYSRKCALLTLQIYEKQHEGKKVAIEVEKLNNFILAEEYHQNYLLKNPNGYCHINLSAADKPLFSKDKLTSEEIEKLNIDDFSKKVLLEKATETPFSSSFNSLNECGLFIDKISGEPLFSSENKYNAGCGWPSFTKPIRTDCVNYYDDFSHNMHRIETTSKNQDSHLGHVFNDGPKEQGGVRFCINGASLNFIEIDKLENTIYENLIPYFKECVEKIK